MCVQLFGIYFLGWKMALKFQQESAPDTVLRLREPNTFWWLMMPPERTPARIPSWLLEAHRKLTYKLTVCSLPVVLVFWYKSTFWPRSLYFCPVSETAEGLSGPARHDSEAGSTDQVALRDLPRQRPRSLVQERTADSTQRPHQHHTQKQVSNFNQGLCRQMFYFEANNFIFDCKDPSAWNRELLASRCRGLHVCSGGLLTEPVCQSSHHWYKTIPVGLNYTKKATPTHFLHFCRPSEGTLGKLELPREHRHNCGRK